jgi:hypothetical protein
MTLSSAPILIIFWLGIVADLKSYEREVFRA